jgi:Domain of unknown function (DUF362)/Viral BACON domain
MDSRKTMGRLTRRSFLRSLAAGISVPYFQRFPGLRNLTVLNDVFWVRSIPDQPFYDPGQPNCHIGLDSLLSLMADNGLMFYRSQGGGAFAGPSGLIAPEDIVLIKVNAQWKYRGCTNSDLIRGLIQRILYHPDGFNGEVVIVENGQGRGSLSCATTSAYGGDASVRANANDESHHFLYLVQNVFNDRRVSATLLDPVRMTFIDAHDHDTDGFRVFESVSYPCFTTAGGNRVELKEGIWKAGAYYRNLKLINVPVLKHHDTGGSEITASLKHFYGVVSMADGQSSGRHYGMLGETCGKMVASVATPVLNIVDAIWVSHRSLTGNPAATTFRANQLLASQDPVALDYWAAKSILYPIDSNFRHHPDYPGINAWLTQAQNTINNRGGLLNVADGIFVDQVTKQEQNMRIHSCNSGEVIGKARISLSRSHLFFTSSGPQSQTQERTIGVTISGGSSLRWRAEKDVSWLRFSPSSGLGGGSIRVYADTAGLGPGKYTEHITVHCEEAANTPLVVLAVLKVSDSQTRRKQRSSIRR